MKLWFSSDHTDLLGNGTEWSTGLPKVRVLLGMYVRGRRAHAQGVMTLTEHRICFRLGVK